DSLVVTELSRMTRSLLDMLQTTQQLEMRKISLISLRKISDTTATGRGFLSMMGSFLESGQSKLNSRAAGKLQPKPGKSGGRPRTDPEKLEHARILYETQEKTASKVCELTGVGQKNLFSLPSTT
ncbi:MAG: recombinase family protein, partial [Sodalis sp. (in: enterobacteria)]